MQATPLSVAGGLGTPGARQDSPLFSDASIWPVEGSTDPTFQVCFPFGGSSGFSCFGGIPLSYRTALPEHLLSLPRLPDGSTLLWAWRGWQGGLYRIPGQLSVGKEP